MVGGDLAPGSSTAPPTTCSYQPSTGQGSNALSCRGRKVSSSWSIAWSHNHKCHLDVTLRCFQIFLGINDTFTCLNCRGLNKQARYIMVVWKLNCTRLNLNFVSGMPRADLYSWVVQKSEGMLVHYDPQDTSHMMQPPPYISHQSHSRDQHRPVLTLSEPGALLTGCGGWRVTSSPDLPL